MVGKRSIRSLRLLSRELQGESGCAPPRNERVECHLAAGHWPISGGRAGIQRYNLGVNVIGMSRRYHMRVLEMPSASLTGLPSGLNTVFGDERAGL